MSLNSSGIVNSDEEGFHLMVKTDESWTLLRLERTTPEVVASDKAPRILSALLPGTFFHLQQAVDLACDGKVRVQGINLDGRAVEIIWIQDLIFVVIGSAQVVRKGHDFLFRNADETHVVAVFHTYDGNLIAERSSQIVDIFETASYFIIAQKLLYP